MVFKIILITLLVALTGWQGYKVTKTIIEKVKEKKSKVEVTKEEPKQK